MPSAEIGQRQSVLGHQLLDLGDRSRTLVGWCFGDALFEGCLLGDQFGEIRHTSPGYHEWCEKYTSGSRPSESVGVRNTE